MMKMQEIFLKKSEISMTVRENKLIFFKS